MTIGLLVLVLVVVALVLLAAVGLAFLISRASVRTSTDLPFAVGLGAGLVVAGVALAGWGAGSELERAMMLAAGALLAIANAIALIARRVRPELLWKPIAPPSPARLAELDARLVRADRVRELVRRGHRIQAIKEYRADTGASLAEAAGAVESLARELREERRG